MNKIIEKTINNWFYKTDDMLLHTMHFLQLVCH